MKTALLILTMTAACATEPSRTATATATEDLNCDPNCDPGNFQYLVSAYVGLGQAFGYQTGPVWCRTQHSVDMYPEYYGVCSGVWADDGGHRTQIFCNDQSGAATCSWWNCGDTGEPACHS